VGELPLLDQQLALIETGIVFVLSCAYEMFNSLLLAARHCAASKNKIARFYPVSTQPVKER
jgi:hypothetical protein